MRRVVLLAALTTAVSAPFAPAVADSTVVVPGLAFPSTDTYLTYFGCEDLYHADTRSPQVLINSGDGEVPAGRRTFGLRMPGSGTAAGPVRRVASVSATTVASFAARSHAGGVGVAYVWYVAPDLLPGQAWAGRTDLSAAPVWAPVDTTAPSYTWTKYDAATGTVLATDEPQTIADFTGVHGDGPGYLLAGFGCDGQSFSVDALRYGAPGSVTTYDLEGIPVATTIRASERDAAGEVTLTGFTVDDQGEPVGSSLVLMARPAGAKAFAVVGDPVLPTPDGSVAVSVTPEVTTEYQWFHPETGYADSGFSPSVRVVVPAATDR